MLERYSLACEGEHLINRYKLKETAIFSPAYQAFPSRIMPVIIPESPNGCSYFHWGTTPNTKVEKGVAERVINIRAEQVPDKPVIKKGLQLRRCLVPADGFYYWKKVGKKIRTPWRFTFESGNIVSMVGIWEEFEDDGKNWHTFRILTVPGTIPGFDARLPFILPEEAESTWLDNDTPETELLNLITASVPPEMIRFPVTHHLNTITFDQPSLLKAAPVADQYGNMTLFD